MPVKQNVFRPQNRGKVFDEARKLLVLKAAFTYDDDTQNNGLLIEPLIEKRLGNQILNSIHDLGGSIMSRLLGRGNGETKKLVELFSKLWAPLGCRLFYVTY